MTITQGYCTLDELKGWLRVTQGVSDSQLEAVVNATSRAIDRLTGHQFYAEASATARVFSASFWDLIEVDDISSTTGLVVKTDQDLDGTYETTWSTSDYQLEPINYLSRGRAVWRIRRKLYGAYFFPVSDQALVQVTAAWGWPSVPAEVKQACLTQASRWINRRDSPFGILQTPDMGVSDRLSAAFDPDVKVMLQPFMRLETPL